MDKKKVVFIEKIAYNVKQSIFQLCEIKTCQNSINKKEGACFYLEKAKNYSNLTIYKYYSKAMIWQRPKAHVCERLTQIGVWEATDSSNSPINGPEVRCDDCGLEFHLTWEKWEDIPEEKRRVAESFSVT